MTQRVRDEDPGGVYDRYSGEDVSQKGGAEGGGCGDSRGGVPARVLDILDRFTAEVDQARQQSGKEKVPEALSSQGAEHDRVCHQYADQEVAPEGGCLEFERVKRQQRKGRDYADTVNRVGPETAGEAQKCQAAGIDPGGRRGYLPAWKRAVGVVDPVGIAVEDVVEHVAESRGCDTGDNQQEEVEGRLPRVPDPESEKYSESGHCGVGKPKNTQEWVESGHGRDMKIVFYAVDRSLCDQGKIASGRRRTLPFICEGVPTKAGGRSRICASGFSSG